MSGGFKEKEKELYLSSRAEELKRTGWLKLMAEEGGAESYAFKLSRLPGLEKTAFIRVGYARHGVCQYVFLPSARDTVVEMIEEEASRVNEEDKESYRNAAEKLRQMAGEFNVRMLPWKDLAQEEQERVVRAFDGRGGLAVQVSCPWWSVGNWQNKTPGEMMDECTYRIVKKRVGPRRDHPKIEFNPGLERQ